MMETISLNGDWRLRYSRNNDLTDWSEIHAKVPGNVELDFIEAGLLPDLVPGNNVYTAMSLEEYHWLYIKDFELPKSALNTKLELLLKGVDCFAIIKLNGVYIGSTENMLIEYRFDISELVRDKNLLEIHIEPSVFIGRKYCPTITENAPNHSWESLRVRKAPHMYGWDIAPRLVSAGLWRGVYIESIPEISFGNCYFATMKIDTKHGNASVLLDWDLNGDNISWYDLDMEISLKPENPQYDSYIEKRPVMGVHGRTVMNLDNVAFWWPKGAGQPECYTLTLKITDYSGFVLARKQLTVAVRTVSLNRTEITSDKLDGDFSFIVNGERIFIKGSNWIALDALHSRDKEHLNKTFDMAVDLNCNMLRCWGGNVYEDHDFFDLCDHNGIMVWQDFALACLIYPQDKKFLEIMRTEAEFIVKKLRNHPSLVLWSGNNEIDEASVEWGPVTFDPNKVDLISRKLFPEIIEKYDPYRSYLPSSPYFSPKLMALGADRKLRPEAHLWGPRNDFKSSYYRESNAHFVSETGYHGCPDMDTMFMMFTPEGLWPWKDNDEWLTKAVRPIPRQTVNNYRVPLMAKQIKVLFDRELEDLEDYILASQISQGEANKFFIENFRVQKEVRGGILWWNLRDCWPIFSDAVVDYYYRKKLAYHYIKNSQEDICPIVREFPDNSLEVVVVNDTLQNVTGTLRVTEPDYGTTLIEKDIVIGQNSKINAGELTNTETPVLRLLNLELHEKTVINHYISGPRPFNLRDFRRWLQFMGMEK